MNTPINNMTGDAVSVEIALRIGSTAVYAIHESEVAALELCLKLGRDSAPRQTVAVVDLGPTDAEPDELPLYAAYMLTQNVVTWDNVGLRNPKTFTAHCWEVGHTAAEALARLALAVLRKR